MSKKVVSFLIFLLLRLQIIAVTGRGAPGLNDHHRDEQVPKVGELVRRDQRKTLVSTEYGEISAVEISDGAGGHYHLQFITLDPNALFLPVLLHADMIFYVHTGSGRLNWVEEDEMRRVNLERGDVYRMRTGTVFFVQSNLEMQREKLRIYALFTNSIQESHQPFSSMEAYSSIRDLVLGFDKKVLQATFRASEEVIEEITSGAKPPVIMHAPQTKGRTFWEFEAQFMKALLGSKGYSMFDFNNKKYKTKTFNILKAKPDFENCNGWSLMVTKKNLPALRGSDIGLFMVNLTKGSMMGPHWNPMASEISIVVQGRGMVRVVCSSTMNESGCKDTRFVVEEGDVFVVPRFLPMAQMAFNDGPFVFMGYSTTTKKNHPQFLVGKASVLQTLDRQVVAASFNVTNTTITQLLAAQGESVILDCTSCAEEREEEEARKREEEEKRRREEEEEARKREEEKRREEEEEARQREEEEEEEERRRQEKEEEARRREEEEEKARRREEEEEEARRREEEEEEEEEEEARRKEEERRQEEARKREEEEAEEEEARRKERKREEEEKRRRQEEAEREEEEARRREQEREEMERQEEEARRERERREEEEEEQQEEEEERGGGSEGERQRVLKKIWKV